MISYQKGDATLPVGDGMKFIVHVCNNKGGWGKGFVLAVSSRWKKPEAVYRKAFEDANLYLGQTQFVRVEPETIVVNMIAQRGYASKKKTSADDIPLRYDFLSKCLKEVADEARAMGASIHMPRIGCGLAGGTWDKVEQLINETMDGLDVVVYDL